MNDLRLSIRQNYAAIGIDTYPTQQQIQSASGDLQIQQSAAKMDFSSEPAQLIVDSSQAQHALMRGPNLEWSSYVTSQLNALFHQQLAEIVAEGNRTAMITNPSNAFAEIARNNVFRPNPVNYQAVVPDVDNVEITYQPGESNTVIEGSPTEIQYAANKPDIQVMPGKTDIYLRQKNNIDIQVSSYNILT
ncbi:DUF6470 family protein [Cohnella mopanensis]|uniref:DUF6470 family protein n=1 Tax=Cohnella mopanensis TaxID=2911966 RepID=UPI001EF84DB1|nr:DUF6470 family protein [Cohnella mopanensis]